MIVISNTDEGNEAARFYAWLHDALRKTEGPLPEAVLEVVDSLKWGTPITEQEGLVEIRSLLAILV
jgi:hypothetical protein